MKRAVILGSGMIGSAMAIDLAREEDFDVTVADVSQRALAALAGSAGIRTVEADMSDPDALAGAVDGADVVVAALPSRMGFSSLRAIIEAGRHVVDISFMIEDPMELTELAQQREVIAVTDCGIAPGISNMLAGYAYSQLDEAASLEIYVGGLPVERRWPYEYKVPFAPSDLIEEFVRPARLVVNGEIVVREALSEPELIDVPGLGSLEAFNTDGLRSLTTTLAIPNMIEKTVRYPGHIELMRVLRASGFFSAEPIDAGGVQVSPRDVTAALLFPRWTYEPGEADLSVLRVIARGRRGGKPTELRWDLLDYHDAASDTRSMSRMTGYPATAVARMIARGEFPLGPGVWPPELPGQQPGFVDAVLGQLAARGVHCAATIG